MRKSLAVLVVMCMVIGISLVVNPSGVIAQQSWVTEVRTGKVGPSPESICIKLKELYKIAKSDWPLKGRTVGLAVAKDMLSMFQVPPAIRANFEVCVWESKYQVYFDEGTSVMDTLVEVLDGIGAKPQDIGTTPVAMRQTLLQDLKKWLVFNTDMVKKCQAGSADACGILSSVIGRATQGWNYTAQELGLSQDQLAKLKY